MKLSLRAFGLVSVVFFAAPATASPRGFGLQLGASFDPGDLLGGVHYRLPITAALDLAPAIDVGTVSGLPAFTAQLGVTF